MHQDFDDLPRWEDVDMDTGALLIVIVTLGVVAVGMVCIWRYLA